MKVNASLRTLTLRRFSKMRRNETPSASRHSRYRRELKLSSMRNGMRICYGDMCSIYMCVVYACIFTRFCYGWFTRCVCARVFQLLTSQTARAYEDVWQQQPKTKQKNKLSLCKTPYDVLVLPLAHAANWMCILAFFNLCFVYYYFFFGCEYLLYTFSFTLPFSVSASPLFDQNSYSNI